MFIVMGVLAWSASASAQSAGSFPEPAAPPAAVPPPAPPQAYAPPAPVYTPPAPTPVPAPSAPAAPPPNTYAPLAPQLPPYAPPAGLSSLPPLLPYKKGLPVPPGYRVVERSATGLMVGGGLTFLAAYAAGLGLAASQSFDNGTAYTAIPIVGPWAAIGGRSFSCKVPVTTSTTTTAKDVQRALNKCVGQAFDEVTTVVFLTADGLIQATGAVLFFVGLGSGYEELVREDLPKTAVSVSRDGFSLSVSGNF